MRVFLHGVSFMRVLVEDDAKVSGALRAGLAGEGYEVVLSRTGEDGFFRATTEPFDAVLLDLGLPGRDGLQILAALRQRGLRIPVIVITARDAVDDRVLGLDDPFLPYAENDQVVYSQLGEPVVYARNVALPRASLNGKRATTQAQLPRGPHLGARPVARQRVNRL